MERLKVASLFSGCGGTDLGVLGDFRFNGIHYDRLCTEIVFANDNDNQACDIFDANFKIRSDRRDIREISPDDIPDIDILTGGFPCQSFSVIAQNPKRLGVKDENGKLFFEMCRLLKAKQPSVFVAENVKGILSANKGQAFPLILNEFRNCGYKVDYKVVLAADYGVPQKRERVFILGIRNDIKGYLVFPMPTHNKKTHVPLSVALDNNVDEKYFFSQKAIDGMLRRRKRMNAGRAQDPNKPCNTVGAHLAKISLNSTDPVFLDNGRYRRFTPREVARIQSFPDSFILVGSDSAKYRALGNAIPPVLFWHLATAIQALLLGNPFNSKTKRVLWCSTKIKDDDEVLTLDESNYSHQIPLLY